MIPQEVIQFVAGSKELNPYKYFDLTKFENSEPKLKTEEELGNKINWWFYLQMKDLFNRDKKTHGIRKQNMELEIILIEENNKENNKYINYCLNGTR